MLILKILGFLLKAIGIILLTLLALIVLLLLIVLFAPVRYRASIVREGTSLTVKARISWLGSILRIPITFQDGALDYKAKLLCFTVFPGKKKAQAADNEAKAAAQTEESPEESSSSGTNQPESEVTSGSDQPEGQSDTGAVMPEAEQESEVAGFFEKILYKLQQIADKIKETYQRLVIKLLNIKNTIRQKLIDIREKICRLKGRVSKIITFLKAEDTKFALKLAGKSIFQLIKYILPYKIKGEVVFGTGDPYSMGQALSVLGIFYGVYARTLQVEADFETSEFRLDMKLELKGRIRMIRLLFIALKLWFKGKLKQVIANAKGLMAD